MTSNNLNKEDRQSHWKSGFVSRFIASGASAMGRKKPTTFPWCQNADYRGGVTCPYDTQLLGACLHASECGGRYRPQAVRGMPDVLIAPPATGPPEGWAAFGFVGPACFGGGLWARLLRVLGSLPLILGSEWVRIGVVDRF